MFLYYKQKETTFLGYLYNLSDRIIKSNKRIFRNI